VVGPFQGDVESYTTVDLNANYRFTDHWKVGVNVANLLDDEHWESFGGDLLGRRALGHVEFSW
jgi:outer membrane receptor protein involved in Fe transport